MVSENVGGNAENVEPIVINEMNTRVFMRRKHYRRYKNIITLPKSTITNNEKYKLAAS